MVTKLCHNYKLTSEMCLFQVPKFVCPLCLVPSFVLRIMVIFFFTALESVCDAYAMGFWVPSSIISTKQALDP